MKQKSLLRSMLLLCALIVGMSSAWGQVVSGTTYNTQSTSSLPTGWSGNGSGSSYIQLTSSSNYIQTSEFTQNGFTSVKLKARKYGGPSDAQALITVSWYDASTSEETVLGTVAPTNTTLTDYTISSPNNPSGNTTGYIKIQCKGASSSKGSGVSQVTITYTTGVAKTLSSITLSGDYPTTFTEKDEFSHEGMTVTASYDDNTTSDVTNLATFTGYNMNTVGSQTVEVSYTEGEITKTATYGITVNAGPKYTVSFNAEGGSCSSEPLTETEYQGGVTLPAATISVAGWVFAGWATATVANTTTRPVLYAAGSTYKPTANCTLYAVYKLDGIDDTKYKRATQQSEVTSASSIVIVNNKDGYVLDHSRTTQKAAPVETNGLITPEADIIFAFSGNNTNGFTITGENGTLGIETLPTSSSTNKATSWTTTNNKWVVGASSSGTNTFYLKNTEGTYVALDYYSGWQAYYVQSYASNQYTALKLYIPVPNAYNSNPTAIITPTVEFENDGTTLYLDGTKTYTNAANVTGVTKPITYSSSDTNVAEVDATGKVTAKAIGTATITASVEAELGVSAPASATYDVVVKSTTTIAGIKAVNSTTTATAFTADLTDANITYVSGTHAYIQDADNAIYVSCATSDWVAGKKFNGAVSGKVKKSYGVWEITELTGTPIEGGSVPAALTDVAIADITSNSYANYEGKKITLTGVTVTGAMASTATSGGEVSDGTNTIKIGAPATGITLVKDEKGSVTGFVAQYSGTYRLNLYEQSQFAKTHNAPTAQPLEFASDAFELDEDTEAYTNFNGQQVSGAKGTVSYETTSDANNIITSLNAETGAVVLSGAYGTATIEVTAAAIELTEGGVITPYTETKKTYTITVYPRYSVVFSINGVETTVRQEEHGASIAVVSKPDDIGAYKFQGWVENEVAAGSSKPESYVALSTTYTPTANKIFYAVYALEAVLPDVEQTSTFSFSSNSSSSAFTYVNGEITWSSSAVSSDGLKSQSLTFTPSNKVSAVKEIELSKNSNAWGQTVYVSLTDADNTEIFKIYCNSSATNNFDSNNKYTKDLTNYQSSSYKLTSNGNAWLSSIKVTYLAPGFEYSDYRTSITVPETTSATIAASGYTTFCSPYDLSFENVDGLEAAYVVSASTNAVATLKRVTAVPGGTGVVLKGTTGGITIPIVEYTGDEISNLLLGTLKTTTVTARSVYVISEGKFKIYTGTSIPAGKAYLPISAVSSDGNAPSLSFEFDDETTSIENVNRAIINDNQYYTLDGRRVETPSKGLYIINGKKVVVK